MLLPLMKIKNVIVMFRFESSIYMNKCNSDVGFHLYIGCALSIGSKFKISHDKVTPIVKKVTTIFDLSQMTNETIPQ